ncbi:hypothetical protein ACVWXO_002852 [Bradyrhizobium sp. LM2.7]
MAQRKDTHRQGKQIKAGSLARVYDQLGVGGDYASKERLKRCPETRHAIA